jgi:hypothetical protein
MDSTMYVKMVIGPHLSLFWHYCCKKYGLVTVLEDRVLGYEIHAITYQVPVLNEMDVNRCQFSQSSDVNLKQPLR